MCERVLGGARKKGRIADITSANHAEKELQPWYICDFVFLLFFLPECERVLDPERGHD